MQNRPQAVSTLCIIQTCTNVGLAYVQSMLVLYAMHVLKMDDQAAYTIFTNYSALMFVATLVGGYLGGRYLPYQTITKLSLLVAAAGLTFLFIHNFFCFYLGLALFTLGHGLRTPNLFNMLGQLYGPNESGQRESGFAANYIAANLGVFLGYLSSGSIAQHLSYNAAFLLGAMIMLIAWFILMKMGKQLDTSTAHIRPVSHGVYCYAIIALLGAAILWLLHHPQYSKYLLLALGVASLGFILWLILRLQNITRNKVIYFLVLTLISIGFWTLYILEPTVLTVLIERNIDRTVFGWQIPTPTVSSFITLFIFTVGPIFSYLLATLGKHNKTPAVSTLFVIGVFIMGASFWVIVEGMTHTNLHGLTPLYWIVICYFLQTIAQLLIGPIGLSMVGTLVPKQYEGIGMGIFQLSIGISSIFSGMIATALTLPKGIAPSAAVPLYQEALAHIGLFAMLFAIIAFTIVVILRKWLRVLN